MASESTAAAADFSGRNAESINGNSSATPRLLGVDLAQKTFGGLLNPVEATVAEWNRYTMNRYKTIKEVKSTRNIFPRRKGYESPDEDGEDYSPHDHDIDRLANNIRRSVRKIEEEMELPKKSLQKCVRIITCDASLEEVDDPRTVNVIARIWSPSTPSYVDVHLFYHHRTRYYENEWHYALGYNVHRRGRVDDKPADPKALSEALGSGLQNMHSNNGWRSICWGGYDDSNGNFGRNWRRVEMGAVDLHSDSAAVIDVCEALFGELVEPAADADADEAAHLERRLKLVTAIRLLMAVVGIDYEIACKDGDSDVPPEEGWSVSGPRKLRWHLEGLQDHWVARGVRRAAGFQLAADPEKAEKGKLERIEMAKEPENDGYCSDDPEEPECTNQ